jgi:hypothetical protein
MQKGFLAGNPRVTQQTHASWRSPVTALSWSKHSTLYLGKMIIV